jgi:hypothetical protein
MAMQRQSGDEHTAATLRSAKRRTQPACLLAPDW